MKLEDIFFGSIFSYNEKTSQMSCKKTMIIDTL